jgi:hypothetical protein
MFLYSLLPSFFHHFLVQDNEPGTGKVKNNIQEFEKISQVKVLASSVTFSISHEIFFISHENVLIPHDFFLFH